MQSLTFKSPDEYKPGEILITNSQIKERVKELAKQISYDYKDKELLILSVLKGAFKITNDLSEELHLAGLTDLSITFMTLKSYPTGTISSSAAKIIHHMDIHPKGKNILIVDDIIDTGKSLDLIKKLVTDDGCTSVKTLALIDKKGRREVDLNPDYAGFEIPNIWIQGYGMDTDELGRAEPNIIIGPHKYNS